MKWLLQEAIVLFQDTIGARCYAYDDGSRGLKRLIDMHYEDVIY